MGLEQKWGDRGPSHPSFHPGGMKVSGTSGKTVTLNERVEGRLGLAAIKSGPQAS